MIAILINGCPVYFQYILQVAQPECGHFGSFVESGLGGGCARLAVRYLPSQAA